MKIRLCQPLPNKLSKFLEIFYDPKTLEVKGMSMLLAILDYNNVKFIDFEFEISSRVIPKLCDSILGVKIEKYKLKIFQQHIGDFEEKDRYEIFLLSLLVPLKIETENKSENITVIGRMYNKDAHKKLLDDFTGGMLDRKLNLLYGKESIYKVSDEDIKDYDLDKLNEIF